MLGHLTVDSYVGVLPVLYPLLIGILVFGLFGVHGTALLVVPGLLGGAYLLWRMRRLPGATAPARPTAAPSARVPVMALTVVILVMMSRAWTVNVFQAFTPTW